MLNSKVKRASSSLEAVEVEIYSCHREQPSCCRLNPIADAEDTDCTFPDTNLLRTWISAWLGENGAQRRTLVDQDLWGFIRDARSPATCRRTSRTRSSNIAVHADASVCLQKGEGDTTQTLWQAIGSPIRGHN